MSHAIAVQTSLSNLAFSNRAGIRPTASDPKPLTRANFDARISPFAAQFFAGAHRSRHWELCTLAVPPEHQHRGIGRQLAEWGLERARGEGVPAVVIAAKDLEGFYQMCGFEELVGVASEAEVDGMMNPLKERGIGGGAVLWTKD